MAFGGAGLFKGWATFQFNGWQAPAAAAPSSINTGLVLPAYNTTYGALGNDLDGRKLAMLDGTGGWLLLPDVCNGTGEFYTCFNSDGTTRWQKQASDVNASATRFAPFVHYDTVENIIYVAAHSTDLSVSSGVVYTMYVAAFDATTGAVTLAASHANNSTPIPAKFTTANLTASMVKSRGPSFAFRNGMMTGNFTGRWLGREESSASGFTGVNWGNGKKLNNSTWVQYSGYAGANDDIYVDYFMHSGTLRVLRKGQYGSIGWNQIPGGGPTLAGGLTGEATLPQYCQGIAVQNWGENQVALIGFTTELIFGQRYYPRDLFDAWLHNVADYLGLPAA